MRVGLYSPYLSTMGGGERYFLTIAEFFLKHGADIDLFSDSLLDLSQIEQRFDLNLVGLKLMNSGLIKANFWNKFWLTKNYDFFFFLSDGSLPFLFAKNNIIHFQFPLTRNSNSELLTRAKLSLISKVICNSHFTKKYIDNFYSTKSDVLYPPVDVEKFSPSKKEKIILSVGRFFSPLHPKKHQEMAQIFSSFCHKIPDWKLVFIGGMNQNSQKQFNEFNRLMKNFPIEFHTNVSFHFLKNYYSKATIYWHATGFGEDLEKFPEKAEHFGISTVEAMASGCVPIVFAGGGQVEVVEDNVSGMLWHNSDELIGKTIDVINNFHLREKMIAAAIEKSKQFSKENFYLYLSKLMKHA